MDAPSAVLATNRYALRDYETIETCNAGMVLLGGEIKSLRRSHVELAGAYVQSRANELWLVGAHIAVAPEVTEYGSYDPLRLRKLLMQRREIDRLVHRVERQRLVMYPINIHLTRGRAKLNFGIGRALKKVDRREAIRRKEVQRQKEGQQRRGARGGGRRTST